MLLGIWKNIEELEESLSLPELESIVVASREKEKRERKFLAALKGIDLEKDDEESNISKFEEVQRRVNARLSGKSEEELELDDFGLDIESD